MTPEPSASRSFTLDGGGPFLALLHRLHLVRSDGKVLGQTLALIAWLPLMFAAGLRMVRQQPMDPTLFDLSEHTRLLIALPAILLAHRLSGMATQSTIHSLYRGKICEAAKLDRIVARGEHLRDLWWPELVLAGVALLGGQLVLWRLVGGTGVFSGETLVEPLSFSRVWYGGFALPLVQFVMFRWLWRWAIWSSMLFKINRLPLSVLATHPDRAAGLACLARPMSSFAVVAFGLGSILAGAGGTQLLAGRTTVQEQMPALLVFVLSVLALAAGPLLPFSIHLYRARRRTLSAYGDFANEYMRGFHARWVASHRRGDEALGSPDIQSLNDLGGAYTVISNTRFVVFGMRSLLELTFGAVLPFLPLIASLWTVEALVGRILKALLGGLPV